MSERIPLFPLNAVLFPDGVLPLQIFEVRYLDMVKRCREAQAPFGVISLEKGREVRVAGVQEALADTGTLAHIVAFEAPQPALYRIHCSGGLRFRTVEHWQEKNGLWMADVELLKADEPVDIPPPLQRPVDLLGQLIASLQKQMPAEHMPIQPPFRLDECGWVANRWAEILPITAHQRLGLLDILDPLERLQAVQVWINALDLDT